MKPDLARLYRWLAESSISQHASSLRPELSPESCLRDSVLYNFSDRSTPAWSCKRSNLCLIVLCVYVMYVMYVM